MVPVSPPQLSVLLQRVLAHLVRNEFAAAETLLGEALRLAPDNCDVLHLFGQMRRVQQRFEDAENFYRRALAIEPARPELHHHLGQLLVATGNTGAAAEAFRRAVELKPSFAEAHTDLGRLCVQSGDFPAAEAAFREALRHVPGHLGAAQGLSAALIGQRRPKEAEAIVRAALRRDVRDVRAKAALEHNLAIALSEQGRQDEALTAFAQAEALAPDLPSLHYNRANALQGLQRHGDAESGYLAAIRADPLDLKAHASLNLLLYRLGRSDFLESYDAALKAHPHHVALPLEKAKLLSQAERFEEARQAYRHALQLSPDNFEAQCGIAVSLMRTDACHDAAALFERLVPRRPDDGLLRCNFAICLLQMGDWKAARQQALAGLQIDPHDQLGVALLGLALRGLNAPEEEALNDYERFVRVIELEPPAGFTTMTEFNAALDGYLKALHGDAREHLNQTSRGGTKTLGSLFGSGHPLAELLRARIDAAVADYIAAMDTASGHPLSGRRRTGFDYWGSWSTRLSDRGFHVNHVHPRGWISSAYYVSVPDAVEDETEKAGWLKFGEPPFDLGSAGAPRRQIRPIPGRLVLFPSYMWHGTSPFRSHQVRSTIAFDVVPA